MKKTNKSSLIVLPVLAVAVVVLLSSLPGFSQQPAKTEKHSKVVVKMITDDNGTRTVVDTAFDLPDSAFSDSVHREIEKVMKLGRDGKCGVYRFNGEPHGYNFDFEIPDMPDCPMDFEDLRAFGFDGEIPEEFHGGNWDMPVPPPMLRHPRGGQTLGDLLGDIPMERVKNYTVKETKNGKRITIDIDNAPFFEKKKERVVIIRGDGRAKGDGPRQQKRVKVIVNPDGEDKSASPSSEMPDDAPPPPPPPPPAKKI